MLTQSLKSQIDKLWLEFHSGGITNPITVIEQITALMFARMLDMAESKEEKRAARLKKPHQGTFGPDQQHLRWNQFKELGGDAMLARVRDEVFPFFKEEVLNNTPLGRYLSDLQCLVPKATLMVTAVNLIDELPLQQGDTKGDLYEYLLSKLSTAGISGQFRTPRHIIEAMVAIIDPQPDERVCDPACGTAGFLVAVMDHLRMTHSTPDLVQTITHEDGTDEKVYPGDLLDPYRDHIQRDMFHGFDFDITMLRIAAMNLLLHGIESPKIDYADTLGNRFSERQPEGSADYFDVILANPPFKGSIDIENIDPQLKQKVKTKKTELLFLVLMLRMLKMGGRCAVIVPDGVLFGSSKAHVAVRQMIVDENQLEAVISLPAGAFKPYAGVSTAVLVFSKGGRTDDVWFFNVHNDGYSLDDKRNKIDDNDLPALQEAWAARDPSAESDRGAQYFFVPVDEIRGNKFDLSLGRYYEEPYEEEEFAAPEDILKEIEKINAQTNADVAELRGLLR